jgi:hypothetical protein
MILPGGNTGNTYAVMAGWQVQLPRAAEIAWQAPASSRSKLAARME